MKVLISTDTSCLMNNETFKNYDISVFPLNVLIDEVEYLDGVTITQEELKEAMHANKSIKTSTPPIGKVIEYFEKLFAKGYDRIIHFTISSKLSSMFSLFSTVSANYFDNKVIVIDSYALSSVMLSQVFLAYDELKKGTDVDQIVELVEKFKHNNKVFFIPENLTALKNGGRISSAAAFIGNTIGLKPVISLTDGELVKEGMTRNIKNALYEKFESIINECPINEYDYSIIEFDAKEAIVESIIKKFDELLGGSTIRGIIPINVCAHCGPGTIGILLTPRINGKSLKEFI